MVLEHLRLEYISFNAAILSVPPVPLASATPAVAITVPSEFAELLLTSRRVGAGGGDERAVE
jgi:hypothetical protein